MRWLSTRGGDEQSLSSAIAKGLASDGGLYVPERVPKLSLKRCETLAQTAEQLLAPYFEGDALAPRLSALCADAFSFGAPVRWLDSGSTFGLLEQFHGPTAAFKDFGARFLAGCLPTPATVLVATSGDTGAAVASAFHRRPGVRVVILYPDGRVSARQAHQLGAFGNNVRTFKVAGSFDDCQRMVKEVLADQELCRRLSLTSANSISLGRLLPQMASYAHAALQSEGPVSFVVPAGNLGNALACVMAREMGAPIGEVVLATNANRVLLEYFLSGTYRPRASVATLANAMDVGAPSNLERMRAMFPLVKLAVEVVEDEVIRRTIAETYQAYQVAVCPHTACGIEALRRMRAAGEKGRWLVAATAHPAKFETVVEPLIGAAVPVPPALAELLKRPSFAAPLSAETEALRALL